MTLGTYSMFQGLSLVVNKGRAIVPADQSSSFFTVISTKLFGLVPVAALVFIVLAIVMHIVLHRTRFGYRVQAVGSNPEAAAHAGIPTNWVRLQTLVLMGAICGLSGVMYVGFRGAIDPNEGGDFVLVVIAAVIIGGTPLSGGHGTDHRRRHRHDDHPGDIERPDLLRHRRDLEHLRDRRSHRACRVARPADQVPAHATRRAKSRSASRLSGPFALL